MASFQYVGIAISVSTAHFLRGIVIPYTPMWGGFDLYAHSFVMYISNYKHIPHLPLKVVMSVIYMFVH